MACLRRLLVLGAAIVMVLGALTAVRAHVASHDLPAGPIRERHELMDGIGKNAKIIGDAVKARRFDPVADAAEKIEAAAAKITGLFPQGSAHPQSRAKPEIWTHWTQFETDAHQLQKRAGELAMVAHNGGDVPAGAQNLFAACKTCHDQFRKPEKKK
jgi:cytochrome c556